MQTSNAFLKRKANRCWLLSTVLIGNSNTYVRDGLMITPRGYANKYAVEDGERNTRLGEQAGRSLSTGLTGWLEDVRTRHAAGLSLAEIARRDRLPEDYVAAVLAESADTESDVVMDSECE